MFSTITTRFLVKAGLLLCCASVMAQTPAPTPHRPLPPVRTAGQRRPAPQVVTIVHRLNALKMFRLLARSEQQAQAIAGLDSAFNLLDDVHTSVSAGVAMDDGETIAAWLPDAEVEFGPPAFPPQSGFDVKGPTTLGTPPVCSKERFVDTAGVSVIGPDGKQLVARYVGFDATTGLSILKLTRKGLFPTVVTKNESLGVNEYPYRTPSDEVMEKVASDMGVGDTFHPTPVGVFFGGPGQTRGEKVKDPYFGGAGPDRNTCRNCGECMTGCRHNAKNTLVKNYLYLAEQAGAVIHPLTTVTRVRPLDAGGYRIDTRWTKAKLSRRTAGKTFTPERGGFSAAALGT